MSLAKIRGNHARKAIKGVCSNDPIYRSKAVEGKLVHTDLAVLNRWNLVWGDARRCPVKNTRSYELNMLVFIVTN